QRLAEPVPLVDSGCKRGLRKLLCGKHSILKFFQVDSTGMFRMTSSARYFKKGVGSSHPNGRWIMCFLERPKANISCRLLLDSRVVNLLMSSNPIVVTRSSLKPFFFNGLKYGGALLGPCGSIRPWNPIRALFDIGDQARVENALAIVRRIKAAIEVEVGAFEVHSCLFGHLLQRFQAFREQEHVGFIDGCHGNRC